MAAPTNFISLYEQWWASLSPEQQNAAVEVARRERSRVPALDQFLASLSPEQQQELAEQNAAIQARVDAERRSTLGVTGALILGGLTAGAVSGAGAAGAGAGTGTAAGGAAGTAAGTTAGTAAGLTAAEEAALLGIADTGAGAAAAGGTLAGSPGLSAFTGSEGTAFGLGEEAIGATGGAAGTGTIPVTTTTAAQGTALSRILSGNGKMADYLALTGQIAPSLLGAYASGKQTDAYSDLAAQFQAMGAPYRGRLAELYADPNAFLTSPEVTVPVQQGTDALARALSTRGNPAGSGTALSEIQNYASNQLFGRLGQEKDRLAGLGGLSAYNQAAPQAATNAIGSEANFYNALGYGAGQVLNPPRQSLADLLRQYNTAQGLA